eukprot:gb/GEZJ01001107.1/.p1 GENE.gb/GEZJ01001107.1/~~gb/GEZJ01001107.1/.p1  ORF type:complete len:952 (-),score=124.26 gb/GEZJ01001107.1/:5489-8182(-)
MQPPTSDSELDLTPSPSFISNLYLRSPHMGRVYASLRDASIPISPPSSSSSSSSSDGPHSPPHSPVPELFADASERPKTCAVEVAPPSDDQLGLRSPVAVAIDDIPDLIKPLALALWKAPDVSIVHGYTRSQVATALAHAFNLHRASGAARAVLIVPRTASSAKVWQKELTCALDEVKVTTLRNACAPRIACLNSLRIEQSPGVVILADKSLKDTGSWNEMQQAIRENQVVNTWDIVISESRGGDTTLNLYHSPFRLVADKKARAGMFVMCSDDPARLRREKFSRHAVRDFVQSELSLSCSTEESIWISPASIGNGKSGKLPNLLNEPARSQPKATPPKLDHLQRTADQLVLEFRTTPPLYKRSPVEHSRERNLLDLARHDVPKQIIRNEKVSRSLSLPLSTSRLREGDLPGPLFLQENSKSTHVKRESRRSAELKTRKRGSPFQDVSTIRSRFSRTERRPSFSDARSNRSYRERSVSVVELLDSEESEDEWHTPPSQLVMPPFFSDSEGNRKNSNDEEWKTAFTSHTKSRISPSHNIASRTKSRKARRSSDRGMRNRNPQGSEFTFSDRSTVNPSPPLVSGLDSPETHPTLCVLESEGSTVDAVKEYERQSISRKNVLRMQRASTERLFGKRADPHRSLSAEKWLDTEETTTPIIFPDEISQQRERGRIASTRRNDGIETPNVSRNISFVEIPDSDIEIIDIDAEVIDLCSDEDIASFHGLSSTRNVESKSWGPRNVQQSKDLNNHDAAKGNGRQVSTGRSNGCIANAEPFDEEHSEGSSLILTGVAKFNPHPYSLTEPERRKYNAWLKRARRAESRGPEGYDAAIKLYTKCLQLCDEDDYLTNRILSLSHENGILLRTDFKEIEEASRLSRISSRPHPPRRRLRRMCSSSTDCSG